ncbi:MAG: uracil-DNA glycosylase [Acidobacteria bacterium]|nr:uracil-DNA glycosylase [Acidobacteriota bacterium]MCI0622002.1 uracil-DNA glycosylase [Acidobacteriota bacterium]MCI0723386.1 uracil-DNA glycosylase [Acidobacteriota bacterium]
MPEDRQFYLAQLKERLQYYREMGIDSLSVKASLNTGLAATPVKEASFRPGPASSSIVSVKRSSLFESSASHQRSGESLENIRNDLGDCRRCKLCSGRTNIVFGSGTSQTPLVFVGEGPGADEDAQGLPFVGAAGQLLTKIIEAIQLTRDQVYICNIVKCRPPGNRTPEEDEIAACSPFLFRQIDSIRPKIICCLGAVATQTLLGTKTPVGKLRGRFHDYLGIQVMPTWHPAYLLRNPAAKRDVWDDVKRIRALLDELG